MSQRERFGAGVSADGEASHAPMSSRRRAQRDKRRGASGHRGAAEAHAQEREQRHDGVRARHVVCRRRRPSSCPPCSCALGGVRQPGQHGNGRGLGPAWPLGTRPTADRRALRKGKHFAAHVPREEAFGQPFRWDQNAPASPPTKPPLTGAISESPTATSSAGARARASAPAMPASAPAATSAEPRMNQMCAMPWPSASSADAARQRAGHRAVGGGEPGPRGAPDRDAGNADTCGDADPAEDATHQRVLRRSRAKGIFAAADAPLGSVARVLGDGVGTRRRGGSAEDAGIIPIRDASNAVPPTLSMM